MDNLGVQGIARDRKEKREGGLVLAPSPEHSLLILRVYHHAIYTFNLSWRRFTEFSYLWMRR
jgi:hypothetical protein